MGKLWISWMSSDQHEYTKGGNMKKPSLSLISSWLQTAWDEIPIDMVKKSFLKTGISNKMDGSEDDELWLEAEEEESEDEDKAPNWATDEKMTQEEWEKLFGSSDDDESFEGF